MEKYIYDPRNGDFQNQNNPDPQESPNSGSAGGPPPSRNTQNALAISALFFGVLSFVTMFCTGLPIPAALGIIFALLSRTDKMNIQAKIGLWLSTAALVILTIMITVTLSLYITTGTMDKIYRDYQSINWNSPNALQDFFYDVQDETNTLYQNIRDSLYNKINGSDSIGGQTASADRDSEEIKQNVSYYKIDQYYYETDIQPETAGTHTDGDFSPRNVFDGVT